MIWFLCFIKSTFSLVRHVYFKLYKNNLEYIALGMYFYIFIWKIHCFYLFIKTFNNWIFINLIVKIFSLLINMSITLIYLVFICEGVKLIYLYRLEKCDGILTSD